MMRGFWPLYVFAFKSQSGSGPASFEPVLRYAPRRTSAGASAAPGIGVLRQFGDGTQQGRWAAVGGALSYPRPTGG